MTPRDAIALALREWPLLALGIAAMVLPAAAAAILSGGL